MESESPDEHEAPNRSVTSDGIAMKVTVILSSDVYGDEEFKYHSDAERLAGVARLLADCKKEALKDGIERDIIIRIKP